MSTRSTKKQVNIRLEAVPRALMVLLARSTGITTEGDLISHALHVLARRDGVPIPDESEALEIIAKKLPKAD